MSVRRTSSIWVAQLFPVNRTLSELCNGEDEDCDGNIDENVPGGICTSTTLRVALVACHRCDRTAILTVDRRPVCTPHFRRRMQWT